MSLRRLLSCLLFATLFAGAQQWALLHEIGHGVGASAVAAQARAASERGIAARDAAADCDKCFQFAHIAGALPGHCAVVVCASQAGEPAQAATHAVLAAETPPYRSRGPPMRL